MCKLPVLSCQSYASTVNWSLVPTLFLHQIEQHPLSVVSPSKDVCVAERQRTLLDNVRRQQQQQRWSAGTRTTNQLHGTCSAVSSNWWCHCPRTTTTIRLRDDNSKHPTHKLSRRRRQLWCFAIVVVVVVDPRGVLLILSHDSPCCDGGSLPSVGLGTFHDKPSMSMWM